MADIAHAPGEKSMESRINWTAELAELHKQDHCMDQVARSLCWRTLRRWVPGTPARMMDIGAGHGRMTKCLRQKWPASTVIAVDAIWHDGIDLCEDATHLSCAAETADVIVSLNMLEHIDKHEDAVREFYRILKHGGYAYIEVPAMPSLYDAYDRALMHARRYSGPEMITLLQRCNFQVVWRSYWGFAVYPLFWLSKRLFGGVRAGEGDVKNTVARFKQTRHSFLLKIMLWVDMCLLRAATLPIGIRYVVLVRKA